METRHLLGVMAATVCATVGATGAVSPEAQATPRANPDRRAVPILMYHVIDEPPRTAP